MRPLAWGVELCQRLGSDNFGLLYDIYHMQIMEGDIIATIGKHHACFKHYHTAVCLAGMRSETSRS